ncbi:MAG: hypothetical protein NT079_00800 [Candidatus Omnitrophica bacterium]|nr:hypothetical protein [Candidatus Omnitrophota bacterium]
MKKIMLIVSILISFVGVCYAEIDSACFDRCISQSNYNTNTTNNNSYCKEKCSRTQEEYPSQQLEILKQQLEIQKQSLEIQKQQLELQRHQQEQTKQDTQGSIPANIENEPQKTAPSSVVTDTGGY